MHRILFILLFLACSSSPNQSGAKLQPTTSASDKADWPKKLRIGMNAHLTKQNNPNAYDKLTAYLEKSLGVPIEISIAKDYEELADQMIKGEVDIADLTPFNYVKVKQVSPEVRLLARQIATGASTFSSYFITKSDSNIKTLEDLRGKTLALVDPRSTSGYLLPIGSLLGAGLDPKKDLKSYEFTGTHEGVIDAVRSGKVDAGAVWSGAFEAESIQGLEVFFKTERIPYDGYTARAGLPESLCQAFQEALFAISTSTEEGRDVLTPLPSHLNGFVSAEDKDYDGIRAVQKKVEAWDLTNRD